jgi:UTP--glucose-1-phosphate uridylyltransferase
MTYITQPAKPIRKAVFPVAGMGSRFLPATKAIAKEMLPIVDKPLIQYAVEEAIAAGITDIIFVTGRTKRSIEDHFDKAYELETELETRGKLDLLAIARGTTPKGISFSYTRQSEPLGLGHAVLMAKSLVGDEPFAVILPDDFIDPTGGGEGALSEMVQAYKTHAGASVLAVQNVERSQTASYGIVSTTPLDALNEAVTGIVEKPKPEVAPSTLAVVGRYILAPEIFSYIENIKPGAGGELQLTDAIAAMLKDKPVIANRFSGTRYDCGSKIGYLQATVACGLKHPETQLQFSEFLKNNLLNTIKP